MITVGIAAYKEPNIEKCLKALDKVDEILVVTPDEETAKIASKYAKVIKEKRREGKSAAMNKILKYAKGDIIVFTDADMYIKKGSIKELVKHFKDPNVSVVCGRPVVKGKGMLGYWGKVLYDIAHKRRLAGEKHLTTNLCAIRKGCVKKIPKEALVDDYIIGLECMKKGKFVYEPKAIVYVKFPSTISDFLKQRIRTFAGYMQVKEWYGKSERSLGNEIKNVGSVFSYAKNLKEFFWIILLGFFRLIAWAGAIWNYKVMKRDIKKIWVPIKSTK